VMGNEGWEWGLEDKAGGWVGGWEGGSDGQALWMCHSGSSTAAGVLKLSVCCLGGGEAGCWNGGSGGQA
jgi:hypothetical protein